MSSMVATIPVGRPPQTPIPKARYKRRVIDHGSRKQTAPPRMFCRGSDVRIIPAALPRLVV